MKTTIFLLIVLLGGFVFSLIKIVIEEERKNNRPAFEEKLLLTFLEVGYEKIDIDRKNKRIILTNKKGYRYSVERAFNIFDDIVEETYIKDLL